MIKSIREKLQGAELNKEERYVSKEHEDGYGELDVTSSYIVSNSSIFGMILNSDENIFQKRLVHGAIVKDCYSLYPYAWTEENDTNQVFDPITLKHYNKEDFYKRLGVKKFIEITPQEFALMWDIKTGIYFVAYPESFRWIYLKKTKLLIEEVPDHADLFDIEEYVQQKLVFSDDNEPINLKDFINFKKLTMEFIDTYLIYEDLHKKGIFSDEEFSFHTSLAKVVLPEWFSN